MTTLDLDALERAARAAAPKREKAPCRAREPWITFRKLANAQRENPCHENLMALFDYCLTYNPRTGEFIRKIPISGTKVGDRAGTVTWDGYRMLSLAWKKYQEHRLAWIVSNGPIPDGLVIDHIDLNPLNNRLSNLRLATLSQNVVNTAKPAANKSGIKGVSWNEPQQKWVASIGVNGQRLRLGFFTDKEEARLAYQSAAIEHFGEFARFE